MEISIYLVSSSYFNLVSLGLLDLDSGADFFDILIFDLLLLLLSFDLLLQYLHPSNFDIRADTPNYVGLVR